MSGRKGICHPAHKIPVVVPVNLSSVRAPAQPDYPGSKGCKTVVVVVKDFNTSVQSNDKKNCQPQNRRKLTLLSVSRSITLSPDLRSYESSVAAKLVRERPTTIRMNE